jgi:hypothetical protein
LMKNKSEKEAGIGPSFKKSDTWYCLVIGPGPVS